MDSVKVIAFFGGLMLFGLFADSTNLILLNGFLLMAVMIMISDYKTKTGN